MKPHRVTLPADVSAVLLSDTASIFYVTGFLGHAGEREASVLITKNSYYFFTYPMYRAEALDVRKRLPECTIIELRHDHPLSVALKEILETEHLSDLAIEEESLSYAEYTQFSNGMKEIHLTNGSHILNEVRTIKTQEEVAAIQEACTLTDLCFSHLTHVICAEQTELQIAWEIERFIREHGAELSFPTIVAFNEHASAPHHTPTNTKLTPPSIILLDLGAKTHGYHADMTRMLFFGPPKKEWTQAYAAVLAAQKAAISYLSATNSPSGAQADQIARLVIEKAEFPPYPHSLGHGVGLNIHERPPLSIHRDTFIKSGMVFSIEPGIYVPQKFGIRIEDLVVKSNNGLSVLSRSSKEIIQLPILGA